MEIGRNIADFRRMKKMTQEELAAAVGVSAQSVSKWENGVNMPDILLLPKIAETLGITVNELYEENAAETGRTITPYAAVPGAILDTMLGIHMSAFMHGGRKAEDVLQDMKDQLSRSDRKAYELFSRDGGAVQITNSVSYVDMTFRKPEAGEVLLSDRAGDLLCLLGEHDVRHLIKAMYDMVIKGGKDGCDFFTEDDIIARSGLERAEMLAAMRKLEQIQITETYERIENGRYVREFCLSFGLVQLEEIMVIYRLAYLFCGSKMLDRTNRYTYEHTDVNTGDC